MRTVGGTSAWDTAVWASGSPDGPYGATWSSVTPATDLATRLADDPGAGEGASAGPHAQGGLRFVVQVLNPTAGIDSVWGTATWDTSDWSSSVGQWEDISDRVRGVAWANGQGSPSDRAAVGTATVTLANRDGLVSPWLTSGPFAGPGARSWVRAGLLVRFGMLYDGTPVAYGLPLDTFNAFFTGKVEDVTESTSDNVDGWVDLTLAETTMDLAVTPDPQALTSGRMLSETMFDAMAASNWPYQTSLSVPDEDVLVGTATVGGLTTTERLQLFADQKHWDICADGRGRVMVTPRRTGTVDSGVTFSNAPGITDMPLVELEPYSSTERVLTQATAARVGAAPQTSESTGAIEQFGLVTDRYGFPRNDLVLQTDASVVALLRRVIGLRAFDDLGIATFTLDADMDAVHLPAVMTFIAARAREGFSFTIRWQHPSGAVFTESVVIEAQSHAITMEGAQLKWTAVLATGHNGPTSGT